MGYLRFSRPVPPRMKLTTPRSRPIQGTFTTALPSPNAVVLAAENSISARTGTEVSRMFSGVILRLLRMAPGTARFTLYSKKRRRSSGFISANACL